MTIVKEMLKERVRRVQVHQHVQKKTARAGFGGLSIQRTPLGTHVRISAERPGLVIGRKGSEIQQLTDDLESKFLSSKFTEKQLVISKTFFEYSLIVWVFYYLFYSWKPNKHMRKS